MNDIITQLKNSNNLKCYIDAKFGHVQDLSGNNLNGTFGGTCKMGSSGLVFDGGVGNLSIGNAGNINSICFIFKPSNLTGNILELVNNSIYVTYLNGVIGQTGFTTPTVYVNGIVSSAISADKFYFVCLTQAANINANAINIGEANSVNFNGQVRCFLAFNKILSATEVSQIYSQLSNIITERKVILTSTPSLDGPKSGLVGHWPLDNINGVTVADQSGNGLNAVIVNQGGDINNSSIGKSISLDGTNTYVSLGNVLGTSSNITTMTLGCWIKPSAVNGTKRLINKWVGTGLANGSIILSNWATGIFALEIVTDAGYKAIQTTGQVLYPNLWQHCTLVYNSGVVDLYVNGVNVKNSAGNGTNIPAYNYNWTFGSTNTQTTNRYGGSVKDIRVYNKVLQPSEILDMYNKVKKALSSTMFGVKVSSGNET